MYEREREREHFVVHKKFKSWRQQRLRLFYASFLSGSTLECLEVKEGLVIAQGLPLGKCYLRASGRNNSPRRPDSQDHKKVCWPKAIVERSRDRDNRAFDRGWPSPHREVLHEATCKLGVSS